jgi:hypothetical protein
LDSSDGSDEDDAITVNKESKRAITNRKTSKIFRSDSSDVASDDDSVEELLAQGNSFLQKMNKVPANEEEAMDELGERYADMSEADFLKATEETMADAREAHLNHLFKVTAFDKRWAHIQQGRSTIPKRQERMPSFNYR